MITTARLSLRPLRMADVPALAEVVFSDPEVVKGLAHDISDVPARRTFAEVWCRELSVDGDTAVWREGGIGGFAISDLSGTLAPADALMGVVGVFEADQSTGRWIGELLYALGSAYHRRGVMTEATRAVVDAFRALPNAGELWAIYWTLLNPASRRILGRLDFVEAGTQGVREVYGRDRAKSLLPFELWRLRQTPVERLETAVRETAVKLGHLAADGLVSEDQCLADIELAVDGRVRLDALRDSIRAAFKTGLAHPGSSFLRLEVR